MRTPTAAAAADRPISRAARAARGLISRRLVATASSVLALLVLGGCTYRNEVPASRDVRLRAHVPTLPGGPLTAEGHITAHGARHRAAFGIAPEALGAVE